MKITLENTDEVGAIGIDVGDVQVQVPARIWVGSTESGIPVVAFITRIAAIGDPTEFERELSQPPTFVVEGTHQALKARVTEARALLVAWYNNRAEMENGELIEVETQNWLSK